MKTNKALKEEYKQIKSKVGVFQVRNKVNGKLFIDSSVNLDKIWNRHRSELNFGGHRNVLLQKEWTACGEDNFLFEILSEIEQKDDDQINYAREAKKLAEMFMDELKPYGDKGYHELPQ